MDAIGAISSIVSLAEVAASVIPALYKYAAAVKNAPKQIETLFVELSAVNGTLVLAKCLIDDLKDSRNISSSESAMIQLDLSKSNMSALSACRKTLSDLIKRLQEATPTNGKMKIGHRLAWPLKEEEIIRFRQELALHKNHLTLALSLDSFRQLLDVYNVVQELRQTQEKLVDDKESDKRDKGSKTLVSWLSPLDFKGKHEQCRHVRREGTGSWFVESRLIKEWYSKESSFLWLYGKAGSGKTILSSLLIDHLESIKQENETILYCYCDFSNVESTNSNRILHTLIAQVISRVERDWVQTLSDTYTRAKELRPRPNSLAELQSLLIEAIGDDRRAILVIDALDESRDRGEWLEKLRELGSSSSIRIFITSRPEPDIRNAFEDLSGVSMEDYISDMNNDIDKHISDAMKSNSRVSRLPAGLKSEVKSRLLEKANGMFRWVQCQLDAIGNCHTPRAVREALENLPEGLYDTYERILRTIQVEGGDTERIAKCTLTWLVGADKQLTLNQLSEAITINPSKRRLDDNLALFDPQEILEICGGLVSFYPTTNMVTLSHFTVQEFLFSLYLKNSALSSFWLTEPEIRSTLMTSQISYLLLDDFKTPSDTRAELDERYNLYPLYCYVTANWYKGLKQVGKSDIASDEIYGLLDDILLNAWNSSKFVSLEQMRIFEENSGSFVTQPTQKELYYFSLYAPAWMVARGSFKLRPKINSLFDTISGQYTPLSLASQSGDMDMVVALLEQGASITYPEPEHNNASPIYSALVSDQTRIFLYLLERTDYLNPPPSTLLPENSLFFHACRHHRIQMVEGMLHLGMRPDDDAIPAAILSGSVAMLKILLDAGAAPDSPGLKGVPPLLQAISAQYSGMAELLLEKGARVDALAQVTPDDLEWAKDEPWFVAIAPTIDELPPISRAPPISPSDVCHIAIWLRIRIGLPHLVTRQILDLAEYWASTFVECTDRHRFSETMDGHYVYLSAVVRGRKYNPVQRIVFRTNSSDQGWSDYTSWHNTYVHSFTWFDVKIVPYSQEAETSTSHFRRLLQHNVHAGKKPRNHTNIWDRSSAARQWLSQIQSGDTVELLPMAQYPGWVNYVFSASIEIYTALI